MNGEDNTAEPSARPDENTNELITQRRFTEIKDLLLREPLGPERAKLDFQIGTAMLQAGEYPTAEEAFGAILVSSPDSWSAAYFLGASFEKQGQLANALASYELAATLNASSTKAVSKIRVLRQRIIDKEVGANSSSSSTLHAKDTISNDPMTSVFTDKLNSQSTKLDQRDVEGLLQQAHLLYSARNLSESKLLFERIRESGIREADAHYGLGLINLAEKNYRAAQRFFAQSWELNRKSANTAFYLGRTNELLKVMPLAIAWYRHVLRLNDNHHDARERLATLFKPMRQKHDQEMDVETSSPKESRQGKAAQVLDGKASGANYITPIKARPPRPPLSNSSTIGVVRRFRERRENYLTYLNQVIMWDFRLERYDQSGNYVETSSVQLKGINISGRIDEGDWVELEEEEVNRRQGEGLRPQKLRNLSTGDEIVAQPLPRAVPSRIILTIGKVFALTFVMQIVIGLITLIFTLLLLIRFLTN